MLLNRIVAEGELNVESVTPVDDDLSAVYQYLIGSGGETAMSSAIELKSVAGGWKRHPWSLWGRQIVAILRLEVKKNFMGKRAILIYLFALAPVLLMAGFRNRDAATFKNGHRTGERGLREHL